ncbi:hypothetical protein H0486_18110 [Lachnospiraceae bacterium MD1]|uniref:Uncharacterized protein n=1 Tax=Variimorphobacter saccharofermentans TaxID=2755051 RepID=A0A839K4E7_9FIRM|nr:hypothetical protein [Variimorphobacter saccharofermentans]MBB2184773.1 hypothetical protein [Variimorphobacter saccharofermentans]
MTSLEELRMKNEFSEKLDNAEMNLDKVRTLVGDLLEEYNMYDPRKTAEKLQYEASRVMTYLEIVFDYVIDTHNDIAAIQEELHTRSKNLRKLCVASGELERTPGEVLGNE